MANMFNRIVKRGLKVPAEMLGRYKTKCAANVLTSQEDPTLYTIGTALQETLAKSLSKQEKETLSLIEKRRSFLLKLDKQIAVTDYGAGSPRSNRTKEEMENGVQSKAMVSSIATASKSAYWATILFKIIRKLGPQSCLELGSCVGISASYQASALKINGKGTLVTLEGSPEIANIAKETFEILDITNASVIIGPFHQTLLEALESNKPIDYFFNDGHHDHDAVLRYLNEAMPYFSESAIIIVDDISWSPGMKKAWAKIEDDNRIAASINLHTIGIALVNKNLKTKVKI